MRQDILSLQERVRIAITTLAELKKTPQKIAGDSWVMYRRLTKPSWDFEVHGVTSTSYSKLFKLTYSVPIPETGFMIGFLDVQYDDPLAQNMTYNISPVQGDRWSVWVTVKHVTYTSDAGGISLRFNLFSTQEGSFSLVEI